MAELDSLLDSLIEQRKASEAPYEFETKTKGIRVNKTLLKGQGVFAEQNLSANDPICSLGRPTMMGIDTDFLPTTCYHCLVVTTTQLPLPGCGIPSLNLKTCNGCHLARFCNRDCQVKSWRAYHKYECDILSKQRQNPPPAILRAVLRVVLLKDRDILPNEEWNRIMSLTSFDQLLNARGRSNLTDMAEGVKHLAKSKLSIEVIQKLIFISKFNAIEIPTPVYGGIGVMVEPLVAKFNHSCEPNIAIHRPQHTMVSGWIDSTQNSEEQRNTFIKIIPLRDIKEGEELFTCYIVPTVAVENRRKKLNEDYFFECNCTRCLSDIKDATDLASKYPDAPARFEQWIKEVTRHVSKMGGNLPAFQKAATAMDKLGQYLEHPVLYTTGDFPELAMKLILEGLKSQAYDEALVQALRIHFLVNPSRFVGRHNPTHVYTMFLMLDILDVLLGISTPSGVMNDKIEKSLQNLSGRGLSKQSLIYWRHRICADLKKRLESSAGKDLLELVQMREEQGRSVSQEENDANEEKLRKSAEEEMRAALKLKPDKWQAVLEESGC